jgi:hypothetical protein
MEIRRCTVTSTMPANSDAASLRKAKKVIAGVRKTHPQPISPETWKAIEAAICIGALGYTECGRKFNISPHAIMMRAKRHGWAVPSKIAKRVEALQKSVTERAVCEGNRACNDQAVDVIVESWAERAEAHRSLVYGMTNTALKKVAKNPPPLESWSDVERADKAARRACGLDDSEATRNISVGMQLINQRLEIITADLPKEID